MALEIKLKDDTVLLFPTPIVHYRVPDPGPANAALRDIVLREEKDDQGIAKSNIGGWHSRESLLDWPYPEIQSLKEWIGTAANRMLGRLTGTKGATAALKVVAWANVSRNGNYNKIHNHPNCAFSGVYYVDIGEGGAGSAESGVIEFLDPRLGVDAVELPGAPFGGKFRVQPEPGLMLLFPAWLYHYVNPYFGAGVRISVAFNVSIEEFAPARR